MAELLRKNRVDVLVFNPASDGVEAVADAAEQACRRRAFQESGVAAES